MWGAGFFVEPPPESARGAARFQVARRHLPATPTVPRHVVFGVAIDVRNQNVMVSDKTLNPVYTFRVPEAFE